MSLPRLFLKKHEDRRLRAGHLWVYSNEVDVARTPLESFTSGQCVNILSSNGAILGTAYLNPHSLICARLLSREADSQITAILSRRLQQALQLRAQLYTEPFYRLVYGESDGLPGLIVDRYGDYLVVQINTAGMEKAKAEILAALEDLLQPAGIVLRNDTPSRSLEGLTSYTEVLDEVPERILLTEHNAHFEVPLQGGQKTGWFYDHRPNRQRLSPYIQGKRILDVFSYLGAWGVAAAVNGAESVTCVETSETACTQIARHARLSDVASRLVVRQGDAFTALKELQSERQRFDVVVLDPPAFIKRKKDLKEGLIAYQRINQLAMQLLDKPGLLVSASCSSHITAEVFLDTLRRASRSAHYDLQILERGGQGPDHPIHPAIPETEYLKCYFARVLEE